MTSVPAQPGSTPEADDAFVGRRVHQLLWDRKMTQSAFGELVGWDQSTVAKRLRGNLQWRVGHLVATARAVETTVAFLVGETDDPTAAGVEAPEGGPRPGGTSPRGLRYLVEPPVGIEPTTFSLEDPDFADEDLGLRPAA